VTCHCIGQRPCRFLGFKNFNAVKKSLSTGTVTWKCNYWQHNTYLNLGCLHSAASVRSGDGDFLSVYATSLSWANLLLILLYCYMFRSYDHHQTENILIARVTQLTSDPL
jgi:hypothetical protein